MGFEIRGVVASTTTPMNDYMSLVGDCIKWLYTNRQAWHSSVVETTIESIVPWGELTAPHAGFIMRINVRYKTTQTSP
jgi:hypothetical protein